MYILAVESLYVYTQRMPSLRFEVSYRTTNWSLPEINIPCSCIFSCSELWINIEVPPLNLWVLTQYVASFHRLVAILNSRFLVEDKQSLIEYLCSCKSMSDGVGVEFSKKVLISLFFLDPIKPLDRIFTFQLAIEIFFMVISKEIGQTGERWLIVVILKTGGFKSINYTNTRESDSFMN